MNRMAFLDGVLWLKAGMRTMLIYPAGVLVMTLGVLSARMVLGPFSFATDALALTAMATLYPDISGVTADEVRERQRLMLVVEASGWAIPAGLLAWLFLVSGGLVVLPFLDDSGSAHAVLGALAWTSLSYAFYFSCAMFTVFAVLSAARDGTRFRESGRAARRALVKAWRPLLLIYALFILLVQILAFPLAWGVSSLSRVSLDVMGLGAVQEGAYTWPLLYVATALFLAMAAPFSSVMESERVEVMPNLQGISVFKLLLGLFLLAGAAGGGMMYATLLETGSLGSADGPGRIGTGIVYGMIGLYAFIGAMDSFSGRAGWRKWIALVLLLVSLSGFYSEIQDVGANIHTKAAKELGDTLKKAAP